MSKINFISIIIILLILTTVTMAQSVETITSNFEASGGVAVNSNGEVFVADFGRTLNLANGRQVYKVDKTTGVLTEFARGLSGASGNAFDSRGNLIQSNIAASIVSKISPEGNVMTLATSGIAGPVGVAISEEDTIFIANCGGNSIARITPDGRSSIWAESNLLNCPNGLAMDKNGNLYTCNFNNGSVIKIDRLTKEVSVLTTLPTERNGHLTFANGRLYVVGRCNHSIYEVLLNGDYKKIAGSGERGNKDGEALSATFNHPNGIDASPDGDTLYINDATATTGDCLSVPLNPVVLRRIVGVKSTLTNIDESHSQIPLDFILEQNYPNPFNPTTKIVYSIPESRNVTLKVFDMLGREIKTLVNSYNTAGKHEVTFVANKLASGVYLYRLSCGLFAESKQMLINK